MNWRAWGDDAFQTARKEDKPVLLSIGYTCHWCHVMERSLEDEEIATYINQNYIAIKVDREERPDVDDIYVSRPIAYRTRRLADDHCTHAKPRSFFWWHLFPRA